MASFWHFFYIQRQFSRGSGYYDATLQGHSLGFSRSFCFSKVLLTLQDLHVNEDMRQNNISIESVGLVCLV